MKINSVEDDLEYLRRHPNEIEKSFSHEETTNLLLRLFVIIVSMLFIGWVFAQFL